MTERPRSDQGPPPATAPQPGGPTVQVTNPHRRSGEVTVDESPSPDVEVSVVLPAYNEADTLERTVGRTVDELERFLPADGFEVIIAEDGCDDQTPEIATAIAERNARVRHHHSEARLGRGGALDRAFRAAEGATLVYFDTDLATDLRHLKELVGYVRTGTYDVATGSRWLPGHEADRPVKRGVPSRFFNALVRSVLRSDLHDHQCGFKAFDRDTLLELLPEVADDHWFWDTEVLVRAQRAGYAVKEFPVDWTPRGDTSVDVVRDGWSMGRAVARTWWQLHAPTRADRTRALPVAPSAVLPTTSDEHDGTGKIAVVTDYPPDSRGLAEHGRRLTNGYCQHATGPITVFAPRHEDSPADEWVDAQVRVRRCWEPDDPRGLVSLFRAIRGGRFDVVHFNMKLTLFGRRKTVRFLSHLLPPVTRVLTGSAVVSTIHDLYELFDADGFDPGLLDRVGASVATQLLLLSDVVTVTTDEHREVLDRKYLATGNVHHLPHGLYTHPTRTERQSAGPFRVLVFGYISPYKDYDTVFEAFERLETEDVELWIAGAPHPDHPEQGTQVRARCDRLEDARFIGYVDSEDLDELYEAVDVQLLPHLTCPGTSGSFRMAKTFRTPTIVYDAKNLERFLEDEDVERVRLGDPDALAACIDRLANDHARLEAMAESMQLADEPTIADNARTILEMAGD